MSRDRSRYASCVKNVSASTSPISAWSPPRASALRVFRVQKSRRNVLYVLPVVKVDRRVRPTVGRKRLRSSRKPRLHQLRSRSLHDEAYPGHWKIGCRKVCTQRLSPTLYILMILTETLPKVIIPAFRSLKENPRNASAGPSGTKAEHDTKPTLDLDGLERTLLRAERFINEFTRAAQESELSTGQPMPSWIQRFCTPPVVVEVGASQPTPGKTIYSLVGQRAMTVSTHVIKSEAVEPELKPMEIDSLPGIQSKFHHPIL